MRKTVLISCLGAVLCSATAAAQTMIPFQSGKTWGYKDAQGKVIVEARYADASQAVDGFGLVSLYDGSGYKWGVVAWSMTMWICAMTAWWPCTPGRWMQTACI